LRAELDAEKRAHEATRGELLGARRLLLTRVEADRLSSANAALAEAQRMSVVWEKSAVGHMARGDTAEREVSKLRAELAAESAAHEATRKDGIALCDVVSEVASIVPGEWFGAAVRRVGQERDDARRFNALREQERDLARSDLRAEREAHTKTRAELASEKLGHAATWKQWQDANARWLAADARARTAEEDRTRLVSDAKADDEAHAHTRARLTEALEQLHHEQTTHAKTTQERDLASRTATRQNELYEQAKGELEALRAGIADLHARWKR
jgi:hypothetical protein